LRAVVTAQKKLDEGGQIITSSFFTIAAGIAELSPPAGAFFSKAVPGFVATR